MRRTAENRKSGTGGHAPATMPLDGAPAPHIDLGTSQIALQRVARRVLQEGRPFSWSELGSVIDRDAYQHLERAMLQAGLLRSCADGTVLTPAGRAILRHYVPSPTGSGPTAAQKSRAGKKTFYDIHDRIEIHGTSRDVLSQHLAAALCARHTQVEILEDGSLTFCTPWYPGNTFLLSYVSFGLIEFESLRPRQVVIRYRLSMRRTRVGLLLSNLVLLFFFVARLPTFAQNAGWASAILFCLTLSLANWIFGYGFGWLLTSFRFYGFIDRECQSAYQKWRSIAGATRRVVSHDPSRNKMSRK